MKLKSLLFRLEVDLCLDEVLWKLAALNRERFLGVQLSIENQVADPDPGQTNPIRIRSGLVRVEEFEFQGCVRRDWFASLAFLVKLCRSERVVSVVLSVSV